MMLRRIGFLLFFWSLAASALTIEITQSMTQARPVAVVPFMAELDGQGLSLDVQTTIQEVMSQDLVNSGYFLQLPPLAYATKAQPDPLSYDLVPWLQAGAENVIVGKITPSDDGLFAVELVLFDVFKAFASDKLPRMKPPGSESVDQYGLRPHVLLHKRYDAVALDKVRSLAHHMADLVYEELLDKPGIFSTKIAYVMVPDEKPKRYQLVVADSDGHNAHVLMSSSEPIMSPSWSPDGKQLAYVSFERHRAEIYAIELQSGERQMISGFPGINGAPAWSPDGQSLAVVLSKSGSPNLYRYHLPTKKLEQLTKGFSIATEPSFSPDGQKILYTSNQGGKPQIYELDLATKKSKRLTFVGRYNARASYTPDGERIVMIHRGKDGVFRIASQHLESNEIIELTNAHLDESPSVAPNGRMVIYGTQFSGKRVLGAVSIDGRIKLRLPAKEGSVQEPAWSPLIS